MEHLKRRQDFVAAARAPSQAMPGMVVQARNRQDSAAPRVGFTCSKKIGNAVIRNRSKRRMREAARVVLGERAQSGFDYVLIGRLATATRSFADLQNDLMSALKRLHATPHEVADKGK
ncbi:MAG TPA: ribonuclease P protein component [Aestuariivirga sp.]|jgi:ribonuclease P protein component|nr:ribonuclease P protein component [Aestuariivirga sp.]